MKLREIVRKARPASLELAAAGRGLSQLRPVPSPVLSRLREAGTSHIYADTADVGEMTDALSPRQGEIFEEMDGNTVNQPLALKAADAYLEGGAARSWERTLRAAGGEMDDEALDVLLYTVLCGRIGRDFRALAGTDRIWETSLQLHMGLTGDAGSAAEVARLIREMLPTAIVKVPFTPQAPGCFLLARDLEREGIPVNFTSTFSARQALAAALLCDVTRTNVFMGRLNDGLDAKMLGEHVTLEAQRAVSRARREDGVKTGLIVASVREWQTLVRCAGCDVFTAPCKAIEGLLAQDEIRPERITSQVERSLEDRIEIGKDADAALGRPAISRLFLVEPEFREFLRRLAGSDEFRSMRHGEQLALRFEEAGFGDFFHAPSGAEWSKLRENKLPDLGAALAREIALDTHYSLLADADFDKNQEKISEKLRG